jgi:hypothetical protein
MKRALLIGLFLLCTNVAFAQENFKIGFAYANDRFQFKPADSFKYASAYEVNFEGKEYKYKRFLLNGVFTYKNDIDSPVEIYSIGQKLSYQFGPVEPFVQLDLNVEHIYLGHKTLSRGISYGVDINAGHFYFRPLKIKETRTGSFLSTPQRSYVIGGGFRF